MSGFRDGFGGSNLARGSFSPTQGGRCAANPGLSKNVPSEHGWDRRSVREEGGKSVVIDGALEAPLRLT